MKVNKSELAKVEDNSLNAQQLAFILAKTPKNYIHERPAKGGGKWRYVSGYYVKKVLNLMFGWDWDFQVINSFIEHGEAVVLGRLTCRSGGKTIVKEQYGNKEIIYKKGTKIPLSIGNDMKAACTDALKKCAAEIGIAGDVYAPQEFKEVEVVDDSPDRSKERVLKWLKGASLDDLKKMDESLLMDDDILKAATERQKELEGK